MSNASLIHLNSLWYVFTTDIWKRNWSIIYECTFMTWVQNKYPDHFLCLFVPDIILIDLSPTAIIYHFMSGQNMNLNLINCLLPARISCTCYGNDFNQPLLILQKPLSLSCVDITTSQWTCSLIKRTFFFSSHHFSRYGYW